MSLRNWNKKLTLITMNPSLQYPYGNRPQSSLPSASDRPEAAISAAAAAHYLNSTQAFANDRSYLEPYANSQRQSELLALGRRLQQPPLPASAFQSTPVLSYATNPLLMSTFAPPPPEFRPEALTASSQALEENRRRVQLIEMLQQQQQQLLPQSIEIMAEAHRLAGLKNALQSNAAALPQNTPNFNHFPASLSMLPSTRLASKDEYVDHQKVDVPIEMTEERKTKQMEDEALSFLGSTTREAKNGLYFDASVISDPDPLEYGHRSTRGGVTDPFPSKVHRMLTDAEANGNEHILSFLPHGRAFAIHDQERFVKEILPKYLRQSQMSSFQRQLNLCKYGQFLHYVFGMMLVDF